MVACGPASPRRNSRVNGKGRLAGPIREYAEGTDALSDGVKGMLEDASSLYFVVDEPRTWKDRLIPSGDLCRGSVAQNQAVEIVQPDGTALPAVVDGKPYVGSITAVKLASAAEIGHKPVVIRFRGIPPEAVATWTVIRAQGPHPPAPAAGWNPDPTGRHEQRYWSGATWTAHVADRSLTATDPLPGSADRAVAAFAQIRQSGFLGPLEKDGLDLTGATDEAIVARLEHWAAVMSAAKVRNDLLVPLLRRAKLYARLGMQTEADRDTLCWAAVYEGTAAFAGAPGGAVQGLFGVGAVAGAGAVGGEFAAAFAASWQHAEAQMGTAVRKDLMTRGRAVAVGYCPKCGAVAYLDLDLRCPTCHHRGGDVATAAMPDAQAAWSAVAGRRQA